jgi:hypothetical protein
MTVPRSWKTFLVFVLLAHCFWSIEERSVSGGIFEPIATEKKPALYGEKSSVEESSEDQSTEEESSVEGSSGEQSSNEESSLEESSGDQISKENPSVEESSEEQSTEDLQEGKILRNYSHLTFVFRNQFSILSALVQLFGHQCRPMSRFLRIHMRTIHSRP